MRRSALSLFLIGAIVFAGQIQAQAQMTFDASNPLGTANTFNGFVFNSANIAGGDAEGAIAVGGDFTSNYSVSAHGFTGTVGSTTNIGVYANGTLTSGNAAHINGNADAYATAFSDAQGYSHSGAEHTITSNVASSLFSSQLTYSRYQSSGLRDLTGAAINMTDPNNWTIDANNSTQYGTLKVFTVNANLLDNQNPVSLNVSNLLPNQTLAINVTGDVNRLGVSLNNVSATQVVWNFPTLVGQDLQGGYVNITHDVIGSVLAPNKTVNQSMNINGIMIASHWTVVGAPELHYTNTKFSGDLKRVSPANLKTPEPGSVGLLIGLGVSTAMFARRRRKK